MSITYITPATVGGLSSGSWTRDVDISGSVPATATGVILKAINTYTTLREFGCQDPSSTDDRKQDIGNGGSTIAFTKISGQTVDIYTENSSQIVVKIIGYIESEGTWNTNGVALPAFSASATWQTMDLSGYTGAVANGLAICQFYGTSTYAFGAGKGGTNSANPTGATRGIWWALVPTDASMQIDIYSQSGSNHSGYVLGFITTGFTAVTPADVALGTTGSFTTIAGTQASAVSRLFYAKSTDAAQTVAIRPVGGSDTDAYGLNSQWGCLFSGVDGSGDVEANISSTNLDIYNIGYMTAVSTGAALSTATDTWTIPDLREANVYAYWPADAGNGTAVPWSVTLDDVEQDSGTIDQTAASAGKVINGKSFTLLTSLSSLSAGTLKLIISNTSAGGLVVADGAALIKTLDTATNMDLLVEASNTAITSHTPDIDDHSSAYTFTGTSATVLGDKTGLQFGASGDQVLKHVGTKNHKIVIDVIAGADNRPAIMARSDDTGDNAYYFIMRTGANSLQLHRRIDGSNTLLIPAASPTNTIVAGQKYRLGLEVNGTTITASIYDYTNDVLDTLTPVTDSLITTGGYVGIRHETYTDNTLRVSYIEVRSSDAVDTTAPGQVVGLDGTPLSDTRIDWTWTATAGASRYYFYLDGVEVARPTTNSYSTTGLTIATEYTATVKAVDDVTNVGTVSTGVAKTTLTPADVTAPAVPTNLSFVSQDVSDLPYIATVSWTDPVDADLEWINLYVDGVNPVQIAPGVETYNISLYDTAAHTVTVSAVDYTGNESAQSDGLSIQIEVEPTAETVTGDCNIFGIRKRRARRVYVYEERQEPTKLQERPLREKRLVISEVQIPDLVEFQAPPELQERILSNELLASISMLNERDREEYIKVQAEREYERMQIKLDNLEARQIDEQYEPPPEPEEANNVDDMMLILLLM